MSDPFTRIADYAINAEKQIAALTDALAGMVRLFSCDDDGAVYAVHPEDMQAVRLLADADLVVIERNAEHVVEGFWKGPADAR